MHPTHAVRFRASLALLLGVLTSLAIARPDKGDDDRWYVVKMQDAKAGWMHELDDQTPEGLERSRGEVFMAVGRAESKLEISILTEFIESKDGKPIRMRTEHRLGSMPVSSEWVWRESGVDVVEKQGDRETKRSEPWPPAGEAVLSPGAAARFVEAKTRAGEKEIEVRTIDPSSGAIPVTVRRVRKDELGDKTEAFGKVVPARAWVVTQSITPSVETIEWLDDAGHLVRGDTNMGGLTLVMLRAEKEIALLPGESPEIMASTLVHPSKAIERPREAKKAVYVVRVKEGELPDLPTTGSQKFERIDAKSGRVTVGERVGGAADVTDKTPYLASTVMVGADDPAVKAVAKTDLSDREMQTVTIAVDHGGAPSWWGDTANKGLPALRKRVGSHITAKSLDVGFATASEVARTGQGDCTEHAVLLAAVFRAAKIPSRCASGLVYVNDFAGEKGVFGFHMWAQALMPAGPMPVMLKEGAAAVGLEHGRSVWVDEDATMPAHAFDAAHIALTVTALGDEDRVNALAAMAPLIGRLEIDVESVEY